MGDCIDQVIAAEGSSTTNDPDDSGHLTKFGISQHAYPDVDIAVLTLDGARAIYERDYLSHVAAIPDERLRCQLFDYAVNAGVERAIKTLQCILRVTQDGALGPVTLAALAARDVRLVNNLLVGAREHFYYELARAKPVDAKFLKGWLRRAHRFWIP